MTFSRGDMLAAVERSPAAAGAHDRDGWVGLFTSDGRIEDPVGSQPHRGAGAIRRFYDTFIGPRDITFHRDVDIVVGSTVMRDLELEVSMASGLTMRIPAFLRYDLREDDGELKIAALYAFWELPTMIGQFLRSGARSLPAGVALSKGLLTNQGLIGTLGFFSGFRGVGPTGKRRFREFLADARSGNEVAVRRWLTTGGRTARMTAGDDIAMSTADLLAHLVGSRSRKLIGSGHTLVAAVDRDGRRDVLTAEVAARPFAINSIRYFSDRD